MEKQALLNTYINNVTMPETIAAIEQMIEADKKSYVVAINDENRGRFISEKSGGQCRYGFGRWKAVGLDF